MSKSVYKRVLLKLSGESLAKQDGGFGIDVGAIKKSCVHIVDKDYKIIPFETMNLFYRDDKKARLGELRNEIKF